MQENKLKRMKELIELLDKASRAYYQAAREIMSDHEYDALYDELTGLEQETGVTLAGSPTQKVGYQVLSALPKVQHEKPMLSLDKTKSREALQEWLGSHEGILSWKLDGLTVVLTYENGELSQAVTRGNGEVGEQITENARTFLGVPLHIPYKGRLVVRGEAVISYKDFEEINSKLPPEEQYKNPRNLCSGSVRQLNSEITASRRVHFLVYTLVAQDGGLADQYKSEQMKALAQLGFDVVEWALVDQGNILNQIETFAGQIADQQYPSDGLVLTFDDIEYSVSLGRTAKFPKDSMAFKWQDETAQTVVRSVEWQTSRTGLINPVAIFDPVELEGTTVQRASVHNLSIIEELKLGIGDRLKVYKANMIIPQISENLTGSGTLEIPKVCPRCGAATEVVQNHEAKVLTCSNPACPAKLHRAFVHFTSRGAMNIEGVSEASLDRFIEAEFLKEYSDLYTLHTHREEICKMEGFGEKSADKLLSAIEASRTTQGYRLIAALGIPGVGAANAKLLVNHFDGDIAKIMDAKADEIAAIDGFGGISAGNLQAFFENEENRRVTLHLLEHLHIVREETTVTSSLAEKTIVITGSLNHFENRDALAAEIEKRGGKVSGSVSAKTAYLVNNDINSTSGKNKKAKSLGIPIISEDELLSMF
ncbi:MAG: NAD-dependent DNA ligase LigA [Firmicutes bacterium]|nr:NAD-dependent DNA ligase LigA [Bacillota bacterium]